VARITRSISIACLPSAKTVLLNAGPGAAPPAAAPAAPAPYLAPPTAAPETDPEQKEHLTPEYWGKQIAAAKKWTSKWHERAKTIERKYLLQEQEAASGARDVSRFPMFWSTVQTVLAAMYGQIPKVSVDRANLDSSDDVARVAALIIERIFNFEADDLENSPYYVFQDSILDRLVAGMGVAWARYEFDSQEVPIAPPMTGDNGQPVSIPVITDERCPLEYVRWADFLYSPCKRWQERRWVARRVPMTKQALVKRFGEEKAASVPMALKSSSGTARASSTDDDPLRALTEDMADVWEIWCGTTHWAYWYVQGCSDLLDAKQDPLQLQDFFPVRRPLLATALTNAYLPRPDYDYAKSQYAELDLIAARTGLLTEALKLVGVYDKMAEGVQRMLNQGGMNQLIPVDNWAMFAEKGGLKGQVDWMPLDVVIAALQYLTERKTTLSQEVYELLGVSDIMRGMAATKETATTQRLKAQFGSARSARASQEIARFVTDNYRMRAEIICRHWQPQMIMEKSQIEHTPDAELAQKAVALLKGDPSFSARVKISADNVTAPDWELEKGQRVEFLQAVGGFISMAQPMVEAVPETGPFIIKMVQWTAAGFKAGKQIEGVLDEMLQAIEAGKSKPKPPPPITPEEQKTLASAEEHQASATEKFVESISKLVDMGFDPLLAAQMVQLQVGQSARSLELLQKQKEQPPQPGPGGPGGPPMGAGGPPPPPGPAAPPGGPPPAPTGGFPPHAPRPLPALPGVPGMPGQVG
jgi:hypothetical protein